MEGHILCPSDLVKESIIEPEGIVSDDHLQEISDHVLVVILLGGRRVCWDDPLEYHFYCWALGNGKV